MSDENALSLLYHGLCFVFVGKTTSFTAEWGPCNHAAPHLPCKEAKAIQKCTIRNWGSCIGKVESTSACSWNLNFLGVGGHFLKFIIILYTLMKKSIVFFFFFDTDQWSHSHLFYDRLMLLSFVVFVELIQFYSFISTSLLN